MPSRKKWVLWGDELYYSGGGRGDDYYIINAGDIEIHLDKNGDINMVIIRNASKYLEPEEIKEIAYEQKYTVSRPRSS